MNKIINFQKYPIENIENKKRASLVKACRSALKNTGMFSLPDFILKDVLEETLSICLPLWAHEAFEHKRSHNIYFTSGMDDLDPGHPVLRKFFTSNHTICGDQVQNSKLSELYNSSVITRFLADVMEKDALFPMADPLAGLNIMAYKHGESLNWHFDRSEFTTTLLLQAPEIGGDFQYFHNLRSDDNPNYGKIAEFLDAADDMTKTLSLKPGTLTVFKGINTIHRISPVQGLRERIVATLSYYETPRRFFSKQEQLGFFGRTA